MQMLEIHNAIQIQKPINEVFEAIVDPEKMKNYFISESTGRMETGANLVWRFPEFDMSYPVQVKKVIPNDLVAFYWESEGMQLLVEIKLTSREDNSTMVHVSEGEREADEAGLKWLMHNAGGWGNFLACLKCYVEHGINLRIGAFDYLRNQTNC